MHIRMRAILVGALMALPLAAHAQTFPGADWSRKTPAEAGINPQLLKEAIDFAIASEVRNPRDLKLNHYQTFGRREPFGEAIGPIKDRGDQTGVIVHKGAIVAEWGEPLRVDMTHSVTKSLLSSVVGVAVDSGMIRSIDDTARGYVAPIQLYNPNPAGSNRADRMGTPDLIDLFDTPHNRTITWNSLLRQTSDWEGTLWGKPDWADRPSDKPNEWLTRPRNKPGTAYKYNDTRVNVLALADAQHLAARAAAGAQGKDHGPDRRLQHLALVRLRQRLGRDRRPGGAVGDRRRPLGRRHVHQCLRHGALRIPDAQPRQVAGPAAALRAMDPHGADADRASSPYGFMNYQVEHRPQERCRARRRPRSCTPATGST